MYYNLHIDQPLVSDQLVSRLIASSGHKLTDHASLSPDFHRPRILLDQYLLKSYLSEYQMMIYAGGIDTIASSLLLDAEIAIDS